MLTRPVLYTLTVNVFFSSSTLIDVHKKVIEQRDNYATDCERIRQSATPR